MSQSSPGILYLNRVSLLGGAERILLHCMRTAADAGYRPVLACPGEGRLPEEAQRLGFEVFPCRFNRLKGTTRPLTLARYAADAWRENRRVWRYCRENSIALLHAHAPVSGLYGLTAARRLKIPMLVHVHDALPPRRDYSAVLRLVGPATARFLCVSQAAREMLLQMHIQSKKTQVIYNGIDPAFVGASPGPTPDVCGPGPHIGIFALIWPLKGQHIFLEAAARLARRLPTAHFYVVGSLAYADDQPYLDRLHSLARSADLAGRVSFTGYRKDVAAWMTAMDAVVLASVEPEALPTVVTEAMALGRPVVGTDLGGTRELIEDGRTGYLVPPRDPVALADKLATILENPEPDLGERAASSIRERFAPEIFAANMKEIYARLL